VIHLDPLTYAGARGYSGVQPLKSDA